MRDQHLRTLRPPAGRAFNSGHDLPPSHLRCLAINDRLGIIPPLCQADRACCHPRGANAKDPFHKRGENLSQGPERLPLRRHHTIDRDSFILRNPSHRQPIEVIPLNHLPLHPPQPPDCPSDLSPNPFHTLSLFFCHNTSHPQRSLWRAICRLSRVRLGGRGGGEPARNPGPRPAVARPTPIKRANPITPRPSDNHRDTAAWADDIR